jgi:dolichyl-diphosphooligosaccharide--protein glycosyltransferase
MSFEKTGIAFASSLSGFFLIGCTAFLVAASLFKKISGKAQLRNSLVILGGAVIAGLVIISSGMINFPAFRYLNAANPFLITTEMLTDSVSEHQSTSAELSFLFFSILMVFAGIGAWLIFQNRINRSVEIKKEMAAFALILGLLGVYFSSAFIRLEVFGGISLIVLASIGASILISKILKKHQNQTKAITKISFLAVIVVLLTIPMVYPESTNWARYMSGTPPTILNGGTHFLVSTNDWSDAMHWLNVKTPKDSVVVAWWDYGYWISTLGERKSVSDNATLLDWQIKKTASMFFSPPDDAWKILNTDPQTDVSSHFVSFPMTHTLATSAEERHLELFEIWQNRCNTTPELYSESITADGKELCDIDDELVNEYSTLFEYWKANKQEYTPTCDCFGDPSLTGMGADYVLFQIAALQLPQDHDEPLYHFGDKGGDVSKAFWMIKIADLSLADYYNPDGKSFTDKFWNETTLGKLIPFSPIVFVDVETGEQTLTWTEDTNTAIYVRDIKYPGWNDTEEYVKSEPFQLVYVSPSLSEPIDNMIVGIFIYKVNHDYQPPNL